MKVFDLKQQILQEITNRAIISNDTDSIEQRCTAIIHIAAEQLTELIQEAEAKDFGHPSEEALSDCLSEIEKITIEILIETIGMVPDRVRSLILKEYAAAITGIK